MRKSIKGILFALVAMVSISAFAEEKSFEFYFKDFSIKPGETKTVQLYLKNNFLGRDFQLQVFFPDGITPVVVDPEDPDCEEYFEPVGRATKAGVGFTDAYRADLNRLRLISANLKGRSQYAVGDEVIANLKVKAADNFSGKAVCEIRATADYGNKLNYDSITADNKTMVNTVVQQQDKPFAAYPAVTIPWLFANGVNGGEYGLADPVAVVGETNIGAFIQDAERNPMRIGQNLNVAGCAGETLMGIYYVLPTGDPYIELSNNMATPEDDNTVTPAVKETTLNNVLFNPEPNEVVKFGGYYRASDQTICAYTGVEDQGQCIPVVWQLAKNDLTPPTDGSYFTLTAAAGLKMPWSEAEQTAGMTGKEGPGAWKNYQLYPVAIDTNIPTGIDDVNAKTVAGVKYVNVAGMESSTPFDGVNIVVTTYTDGSVKAVKMVK